MLEKRIVENPTLDALILLAYSQVERNAANTEGETTTDHYQSAVYHVVRVLLEELAEIYTQRGNTIAAAAIREIAGEW